MGKELDLRRLRFTFYVFIKMEEVVGQHKRARGDVPSLDDDGAPCPTPEEVAKQRHDELIALISGNHQAIGNVGEAVKALTTKVESLDLKVNLLEKRVDGVSGLCEGQRAVTDGIIKQNSELNERLIALERQNIALEQKLITETNKREALETNGRLINLEFSGIPKMEDEDPKKLVASVMALAGCASTVSSIDVAHRKMNGEMMVKFKTREERDEVYDHRFALKGKTSKDLGFGVSKLLFINENLTIDRGQVLHEVRAYMKGVNEGKGKDDCYRVKTVKGIIKVMNTFRKYIAVNSIRDVERMHPRVRSPYIGGISG